MTIIVHLGSPSSANAFDHEDPFGSWSGFLKFLGCDCFASNCFDWLDRMGQTSKVENENQKPPEVIRANSLEEEPMNQKMV